MIVPVILAGGAGTRLWPLSRDARPKQFLPLTGAQTLLAQTARRAAGLKNTAAPLVVGREAHRFLIAEQLRQAGTPGMVMLEPAGRNTAPAAAAAAFEALATHGPDSQLLILPSDHVMADTGAFATAVAIASDAAASGYLTTFGVMPTSPETGYGYIRRGEDVLDGVARVAAFVEKPDKATATTYLDSGDYLWNSGMFLFPAQAYLDALASHAPDLLESARAAHAGAERDSDFLRLDPQAFAACRSDSIDYAVMERTEHAAVVALDAGWSDLGSWSSVAEAAGVDGDRNYCHGDVMLTDTEDCVIHSDGRLVTTLGLHNTLVVATDDAVLVADRNREQDIKAVVTRLRDDNRREATEHRKVYRPWGSYEAIAAGDRFQVKRIIVPPGGRLSLQKHHHRAEHWVVVEGTALVTRGEEQTLLAEDQSTYIPLGTVHRLENPGKVDLVLIEVQSGSYLGEDDIVRYDDIYGRTGDDSKRKSA